MRILYAMDDCQLAAETALRLTRAFKAELTVLFVLDATWNEYIGHDWLSGSDSRADFLDWIKDEELKAEEAAFATFKKLAANTPFIAQSIAGRMQEEIIKEAKQGYNLLILPSPFTRGLEIMRKANIAILEAQPCSILLVDRKAKALLP